MKIKVQKKDLAGNVLIEYEGEELRRDEHSITLEALFTRDDMLLIDVVLKKADRFVEYFYSDRWYNVFVIYDRDDAKLKGWYCNIGKPAVIEEQLVSYIDLALDLWVSTDGSQTVLDQDEFETLKLNDQIRQAALAALDDLKDLFLNNKPPT